ncbi:MAG: hypothetical protein HZC02_05280 [Candidatus Levybacteria bacterium]|nr:hypothetical protein [Candidatus Levybacteria bacterium]
MWPIVFLAAFLAILAGCLLKAILNWTRGESQITVNELILGSAIIVIVIAPLTGLAGWNLAKAEKLSFNEYWNGWEVATSEVPTTCHTNGSCRFTYECNCYWVTVCDAYDKNGMCTASHQEKRCDECPYFDFERRLYIETTIKTYSFGPLAPENYKAHKKTSGLPWGFGESDYKTPQLWLDARDRINSGHPGPVTARMQYDNYILASEQTILRQYSDSIDEYKSQNLLPKIVHNITNTYFADKVSFVGFAPADPQGWQRSLNYLNAGFGGELQGDVHLVIVQNDTISGNPDRYLFAIKAYWQDPKIWGDDAISKNSVIVVIGTLDGQTVSWARATTGMPLGNETLLTAIKDRFPGAQLTPDTIIGQVQSEFYQKTKKDGTTKLDVRSIHGNGELERLLWGLDDPGTAFKRVSMHGGSGDGGGFDYLDVEPTKGQKIGILITAFILSCFIWIAMAAITNGRRGYNLY